MTKKKIVTFSLSSDSVDKAKKIVDTRDEYRNRTHLVETLITKEFEKLNKKG